MQRYMSFLWEFAIHDVSVEIFGYSLGGEEYRRGMKISEEGETNICIFYSRWGKLSLRYHAIVYR